MTPTPPDRFEGTNPDPVNAGDELHIVFTDTDLAGQQVEITIGNGSSDPEKRTITLDENGVGRTEFEVPEGWDYVFLTGPDSQQHEVEVESSTVPTA